MPHRSAAVVLILVTALFSGIGRAIAQTDPTYLNEEQEIFGNGTDGGSGPLLDATNPMDLINRLRQSESMNDATDPSDAIDAALKDFQRVSP
ncbi:MAG: Uncharacterised protein [Synechococcus sp. CC9902]|nr:MAG: Uncharacterised protein [Synechococcus sp. CC9902]